MDQISKLDPTKYGLVFRSLGQEGSGAFTLAVANPDGTVTVEDERGAYTLPAVNCHALGTLEGWARRCFLAVRDNWERFEVGPVGYRMAEIFARRLAAGEVELSPAPAGPLNPSQPQEAPAPAREQEKEPEPEPEPTPPAPALPLPLAAASTLTRQRARAFHKVLASLGVPTDERYALASRLVGRDVQSLTALSEDEARAVWEEAKRQHAARQRRGG